MHVIRKIFILLDFPYLFSLSLFFNSILFLNLKHCISFAKHQNDLCSRIWIELMYKKKLRNIIPQKNYQLWWLSILFLLNESILILPKLFYINTSH